MTSMIYPNTNLQAIEQQVIERGEGVYVYDTKGNKYLEGMSGLWCTSLGYGNEELIEAATSQMKTIAFTHLFGGKSHPVAIALADEISQMVPIKHAKVFFGNSGSDANDTHIKMLRYYSNAIGKPEKRKIITRERAYHGVTVASGSLTSLPPNLSYFDAPVEALGILRTDHPHYYRGRQGDESEAQFVERITANLENLIIKEGPETIAAFIAEPITGVSGVIVPPDGYYKKVQQILNKYNIMFWSDEVICGFGRTGNDFGATTFNIKADLMTLAKQLSSAYAPISASVMPGEMYDAIADKSKDVGMFGHGYTYSGHPVSCAIALKTLEIYKRDNIFEKAAEVGEYMQRRLRELESHELVGEIRGKGLVAAVECVANKATGQAFEGNSVGACLQKKCQENGLIIRGVAGSCAAICPPMIISTEQIDELVEKLGKSLDQTLNYVYQQGLLVA